jgi:hypothetical protein
MNVAVRVTPRSRSLSVRTGRPAACASSSWVSPAPARSCRTSPANERGRLLRHRDQRPSPDLTLHDRAPTLRSTGRPAPSRRARHRAPMIRRVCRMHDQPGRDGLPSAPRTAPASTPGGRSPGRPRSCAFRGRFRGSFRVVLTGATANSGTTPSTADCQQPQDIAMYPNHTIQLVARILAGLAAGQSRPALPAIGSRRFVITMPHLLPHTIQLCVHCRRNPAGFWGSHPSGQTVRRPWCLSCCQDLDPGGYHFTPFDGKNHATADPAATTQPSMPAPPPSGRHRPAPRQSRPPHP